jgi:glycosyltransferase involved in cell wall biosynthesis
LGLPDDKNENVICILLSTFNGANYLAEQLDSLLNQTCQEWILMVRDDGSSDDTPEILGKYAELDLRIKILPSEQRLGAAGSYLALMRAAPDADYYAFCDQDDVWDREKLFQSRKAIFEYSQQPALYCSRARLVDNVLKPIGLSRNYERSPSFENALVQNIAIGCTILFNRSAFILLCNRLPDPTKIIMHDWWCYLTISAFGQVVFDPEPSIDYRQHSTNCIGELGGFAFWVKRFNRFFQRSAKLPLQSQLQEYSSCWGDLLPQPKYDLLSSLLGVMTEDNALRRFVLLFKTPVSRQTALDSLLFRFMLLLKNYS